MIKIYPDSKIYVYCPAGVVTGGAELLHQLVSFLNDNGREAYIVYFGEKKHIVPNDYLCYNVNIVDNVIDDEKNLEVIYEGIFNFIGNCKSTQKILWWLSVDNFYLCSTSFLSLKDLFGYSWKIGSLSLLKRLYFMICKPYKYPKNIISIKDLCRMNVLHGYQSEYAQSFLLSHHFKELVALKDYINADIFLEAIDYSNREDIILYNPKKGLDFTRKLIKLSPDLNWVPIQNMSRNQVIQLMKKAKVYVDFGYHPGKDRLPRECAANGCCIITGSRGSAGFFEDVMVPLKYKFDERKVSKLEIVKTIRWTLDNYNTAINDFYQYRIKIASEKKEFEEQVSFCFLNVYKDNY